MAFFVVLSRERLYFRLGKFANGFLQEELVVGQCEIQMRFTRVTPQCIAGIAVV